MSTALIAVAVQRARQHDVHVLCRQSGPQRHTRCRLELRRGHPVGGGARGAVGGDVRRAGLRVGLRAEDGADEDVHLGHGVGGQAAHVGQPRLGGAARRLSVDDRRRRWHAPCGRLGSIAAELSTSQVSFTPRPVLVPP